MQIPTRNDSQALQPAATSWPSIRPPVPGFRLGGAGAALILSILLWSAPLWGQSLDTDPARTLTVLVYNYAEAPPATIAAGERLANQILAAAGARADWVECGSTLPKANPKD